MKYQVVERNQKHVDAISRALKKAKSLFLATDPDREGEAISWHLLRAPESPGRTQGQGGTARGVLRDHQERGARGDGEPARAVRRSGERAAGAARARFPGGIQSLAAAVEESAPGPVRRPRAEPRLAHDLRAGRRNRRLRRAGILVDRRRARAFGAEISGQAGRIPGRQGRAVQLHHRTASPRRRAHACKRRPRANSRCRRWIASSASAIPRRRSRPRPCSKKPPASSASARRRPCASRSSCTKASTSARARSASSPICAPTRSISRRRPSARFATSSCSCTGRRDSPRSRGFIAPSRRTRRKRTRRSARPRRTCCPADIEKKLEPDQFRLYSLIWKRTVACQMAPAIFDTVAVEMLAGEDGPKRTVLRANGSTLVKPGYISVYQEGMDDVVQDDSDHVLPPMKEGDRVRLTGVVPTQHFTEPPPRFSEASSGQGAGGIRHRPALHLCVHHFDPARPPVRRYRKQAFHRDRHRQDRQPLPHPVFHDLRGLRFHREDGGLPRCGRGRPARMGSAAREVLEAVHRSGEPYGNFGQPRRSRAGPRPRQGPGERQADERAHGTIRALRANRHQGRCGQAALCGPEAGPEDGRHHARARRSSCSSCRASSEPRRQARKSRPMSAVLAPM